MFTVKVDSDLPLALEKLKGISADKWPSILAYAANQTGYYVVNKYKQQMPSFIDRPIPFTVNSIYLKPAKVDKVEATVQWREFAGTGTSGGKYLRPIVEGGGRRLKKFEKALQNAGLMPRGMLAVPTKDAPVDAYGNVPGALYTKILSYLRANPDGMQNRSVQKLKRMKLKNLVKGVAKATFNYEKLKAKEDRAKKKAAKYFTVIAGRGNPLPPGIYERVNLFGGAIRRLFNFVSETTYHATFPFERIGREAAQAKFPEKLDEAIARSLKGTTPRP
jgi:hypothetical protein